MDFSEGILMIMEPLDRFLQPLLERMFGLKAKELLGPIDIETAAWLTIWFRRVPSDTS